MNAKDLLAKLRELKPIVEARYKAKEIGLFGSYVRGEQSVGSDIDVQRKVDVVPKSALREELRDSVLSEMVSV